MISFTFLINVRRFLCLVIFVQASFNRNRRMRSYRIETGICSSPVTANILSGHFTWRLFDRFQYILTKFRIEGNRILRVAIMNGNSNVRWMRNRKRNEQFFCTVRTNLSLPRLPTCLCCTICRRCASSDFRRC